jgi:magnesium transporter
LIHCHYIKNARIENTRELAELQAVEAEHVIWLDLLHVTAEEQEWVEAKFNVELFTRQEAEEIESSSRYSEVGTEVNINSNFLVRKQERYGNEPVSFILRENFLITQRNVELKTFDDAHRRIRPHQTRIHTSYETLIWIFETRIDFDADFLEAIARDIAELSRELTVERNLDDDMLIRINHLQEVTMLIRVSIVDKQRIISSVLKSRIFPDEDYSKMRVMIKDVGSLLEHTQFNFARLEYLQNTFLGLLDTERSKVIKIFTVVTVVFMPPTLIASLYGMNFKYMPELAEKWGYPFALVLMVLSSLVTLYYFKRKKWL